MPASLKAHQAPTEGLYGYLKRAEVSGLICGLPWLTHLPVELPACMRAAGSAGAQGLLPGARAAPALAQALFDAIQSRRALARGGTLAATAPHQVAWRCPTRSVRAAAPVAAAWGAGVAPARALTRAWRALKGGGAPAAADSLQVAGRGAARSVQAAVPIAAAGGAEAAPARALACAC